MVDKSRAYIFTINNYTDEDTEQVLTLSKEAGVRYMICGKEIGEENNIPHYQGFVRFLYQTTFSSMKKKLPRAHIEKARGSDEDNQRYCSKQNNLLLEVGEIAKQGRRKDLQEVREQLESGATLRDISKQDIPITTQRYAENWLKYHEEKRNWKPEVKWYWGKPGVGKTRQAYEWLGEDSYKVMDNMKWFEGYDKHENVLIDDFRDTDCTFKFMLKLLDRYECRVECKCGSRQFLAKKIAITSPDHPEYSFPHYPQENIDQMLRRIDEIIHVFTDIKEDINKFRSNENAFDYIDN